MGQARAPVLALTYYLRWRLRGRTATWAHCIAPVFDACDLTLIENG
jgi:hypothetical protein